MCQITINPTFAGMPTLTGAQVTISGTVTMTTGDPGPCQQLRVSVLCVQGNQVWSRNTTTPDTQGNWMITLPVTCTCNDIINVNVVCLDPPRCEKDASGPIVCGGSTGTGGTVGTQTKYCRPKASLFGFSAVIRCQLVLFIMSIMWGLALGMGIFYFGLGFSGQALYGNAVKWISIISAAIALIATVIYWLFCRRCLCWFWLLIWRVLWPGGILAAWFRNTACGNPGCTTTSWIGVVMMIVAVIVLFVWQKVCHKTMCDGPYEGLLYTVAVFSGICLPLFFIFSTCVVSLTSSSTYSIPPWGMIVLGSAIALWIILFFIGQLFRICNPPFPPPEWDF